MGFSDAPTLGVGLLLVLLVVAVVGVNEIMEFADFGLEMVEALLGLVEVGTCDMKELCKLGTFGRGRIGMATLPFILSRSSGKRSGCFNLSIVDMLDLSPLGVGVAMLAVVVYCFYLSTRVWWLGVGGVKRPRQGCRLFMEELACLESNSR